MPQNKLLEVLLWELDTLRFLGLSFCISMSLSRNVLYFTVTFTDINRILILRP